MPALGFQVSTTSGVPIYRQIVEQVRARIAGGRLVAGDFLPSVRDVAEGLQVNPMTVSKAYSLLEHDGVVELARGQGMRVRAGSNGSAAKVRRDVLRPLLRQVAVMATEMGLTVDEVVDELRPLMEEKGSRR
jgi:GntR family transcriptional regulator